MPYSCRSGAIRATWGVELNAALLVKSRHVRGSGEMAACPEHPNAGCDQSCIVGRVDPLVRTCGFTQQRREP